MTDKEDQVDERAEHALRAALNQRGSTYEAVDLDPALVRPPSQGSRLLRSGSVAAAVILVAAAVTFGVGWWSNHDPQGQPDGPVASHPTQTGPPPTQQASTSLIHVQAGAPQYIFEPVAVPDGSAAPKFTAQQAYDKMHHRTHQAHHPIPPSITVRYGLLTEDDTIPPADRMPVWAYAHAGGCIDPGIPPVNPGSTTPPTPTEPPRRCVQWTFANAATGKDLRVIDQQIVS